MELFTMGLDFGTDSIRALVVNTKNGEEVGSSISEYRRWKERLYCDPKISQFRQHPLDYIESMTEAIKMVVQTLDSKIVNNIVGIGIDTTGSTPIAVDKDGIALSLRDDFKSNPNAMFILWKDHTSIQEAEEINTLAHNGQFNDYTKYVGGVYSSEWFWAKILHIYRKDVFIHKEAYSWVELADWIPALLSDTLHPSEIKRGICSLGHKGLYHKEWGGLPPNDFWVSVDPLLDGLRDHLESTVLDATQQSGGLSKEWAKKSGLKEGIAVAIGAFDVHVGVVGAGIEDYTFVRVMGTSTCDIVTTPPQNEVLVKGICGQVLGSVREGKIGYEAGQSAYGDLFAWWKKLVSAPAIQVAQQSGKFSSVNIEEWEEEIFLYMLREAEKRPISENIIATDWINGRRTPFANQHLMGSICGMNLGTDAAMIMRAWVESLACGGRKIVENFEQQGIPIKKIIALGGVAKKSPFVMQVSANIMNKPVEVVKSEQCCALGAAIFGAIAAGIYENTEIAIKMMASPIETIYYPELDKVEAYQELYEKYIRYTESVENYLK